MTDPQAGAGAQGDVEEIDVQEVARSQGAQLDAGAAAMLGSLAGNPAVVEMLRKRLESMAGTPSGFIDELPFKQRRRIAYLQELQEKHDELEEEYNREREELEAKYLKLYEPLYKERKEVVTGEKEAPPAPPPAEGEEADGPKEGEDEDEDVPAGVPEFWLNVLRNHEALSEKITEKDEAVLEHLVDVRTEFLDGEETGFRLLFQFAPNPFFTNDVLTKTYHMVDDSEPILERAIGTDIQWNAGKNPTVKVMKKKPKKGAKPGAKPVTKTEPTDSFFNFFSPPKVPETGDELSEEEMEALQEALEDDYEIGEIIRDKLVPNAIAWYTGEANEDEYSEEGEEDDEDDEEGDDDEDDDEEDDDDEDDEGDDAPPRAKKAGPTDAKEQPPECKQQ